MAHEGRDGGSPRADRAARGGRRLTGFLQQSLGIAGAPSPQEIKARLRTLAQRCSSGQASPEDHERLRLASTALVQELGYLGFDSASAARLLAEEGCPQALIDEVAPAAGPVARRVYDPLERQTIRPVDEAYARLADRAHAAESMRTATVASSGFGFIAWLAIASLAATVALVLALDFFPRILQPAKVAPLPPPPIPIQLVPPPEAAPKR